MRCMKITVPMEVDVKETNSEYGYTQNDINCLDVNSLEEQSDENVDNSDSEIQNGYNQNPYGQSPNGYNQNPYGQNPNGYNQNPYGQNPNEQNQNPYGQSPNEQNQNPYGQNPNGYNQNPYGQSPNGYNQNPYGQNPNGYNQNPYGQNPNPYEQNPYGNYYNPYLGNENSDEPEIPSPQKGKWGFWIIAAVMAVVSVISAVVLTARFGNGSGSSENSSADLPSHEYTSTVIEHVKTEEPKEEIYTDKIELYEDSQKSCVTVITTVKSNFYGQVTESKALGSGFVISKDGYIVTNAHVVEGGTDFKVRFYDGKEVDALLIGKETY